MKEVQTDTEAKALVDYLFSPESFDLNSQNFQQGYNVICMYKLSLTGHRSSGNCL